MAKYQSSAEFEKSQVIVVNGVKMTIKEFNKLKAEKNGTKKKVGRPKRETSITIIADYIKGMMKDIKVLRSIISYNDNAYNQWGTIANLVLNLKGIRSPFHNVVVNTKQAVRLTDKITDLTKHNDKDALQYVEKLNWKLQDVREELEKLIKGVTDTGVLAQFANHECVNGTGKRLGLRELTIRSNKAVDNLIRISGELDEIVNRGKDAMEYEVYRNRICA